MPADGMNPEKWSSEGKFAIVLEAASLNETELTDEGRCLASESDFYRVLRDADQQRNPDAKHRVATAPLAPIRSGAGTSRGCRDWSGDCFTIRTISAFQCGMKVHWYR